MSGVREFLHPVEHYLRHGQESLATSRFLEGLRGIKFDNPTRFRMYEHVISLFLRHKYAVSAALIYSRMTAEGFTASMSLRVQMSVLRLALTSPDESALLEHLRAAFQQKSFNEAHLRDLLNFLVNIMQCEPVFIDTVVRTFLGTRKSDYTLKSATVSLLVRIHGNAGSVVAAQNWIADHKPATPQPYTDLLDALASADPVNKDAYKWIVGHMQSNGIRADLAFYNVTLDLWISHERLAPVFELYNKLRESDQPGFTPDAHTYGVLFGLLRGVRRAGEGRQKRLPRLFLPDNAPSSRTLFREMVECHLKYTQGHMTRSSPVLTTTVLDKALAVFMAEGDYTAAFIVVRLFRTLKFAPTLSTYRAVLLRLMSKIQREMKLTHSSEEPEQYWTYRFLGLESYEGYGRSLPPERSIFEILLRFGAVARLSLDYIPPQLPPDEHAEADGAEEESDGVVPEVKDSSHPMPSIPVFLKMEAPEPNVVWTTIPLERILRRAILASRSSFVGPPATEVSHRIRQGKEEMFPSPGPKRKGN